MTKRGKFLLGLGILLGAIGLVIVILMYFFNRNVLRGSSWAFIYNIYWVMVVIVGLFVSVTLWILLSESHNYYQTRGSHVGFNYFFEFLNIILASLTLLGVLIALGLNDKFLMNVFVVLTLIFNYNYFLISPIINFPIWRKDTHK